MKKATGIPEEVPSLGLFRCLKVAHGPRLTTRLDLLNVAPLVKVPSAWGQHTNVWIGSALPVIHPRSNI